MAKIVIYTKWPKLNKRLLDSLWCATLQDENLHKVVALFFNLFTSFISLKKIMKSCGYVGLLDHSSPQYGGNSRRFLNLLFCSEVMSLGHDQHIH